MDTIRDALVNNPDRVILVGRDWNLTCQEAFDKGSLLAKSMIAHGLNVGSNVMICLPPGKDRAIAEVACLLGGFPFISESNESDEFMEQVNNAFGLGLKIEPVIYEAFMRENWARASTLTAPTDDSTAYYGRSSGTTNTGFLPGGKPWTSKFSIRTRRQIIDKQQLLAELSGTSPTDKGIYVSFGTACYIPDVLIGAICGITGPLVFHDIHDHYHGDPETYRLNMLAYFQDFQPEMVRFNVFKPYPESDNADLLWLCQNLGENSILHFMVSGPVTDETLQACHVLLPDVGLTRAFGQNEIAIRIQCEYDDPDEKRLTTWGTLARYGEGVALSVDGELLVHRDLVYDLVYEPSDRYIGDWHRTGDRFEIDPDGYYVFKGRMP
jgi:hypothetical protein